MWSIGVDDGEATAASAVTTFGRGGGGSSSNSSSTSDEGPSRVPRGTATLKEL